MSDVKLWPPDREPSDSFGCTGSGWTGRACGASPAWDAPSVVIGARRCAKHPPCGYTLRSEAPGWKVPLWPEQSALLRAVAADSELDRLLMQGIRQAQGKPKEEIMDYPYQFTAEEWRNLSDETRAEIKAAEQRALERRAAKFLRQMQRPERIRRAFATACKLAAAVATVAASGVGIAAASKWGGMW